MTPDFHQLALEFCHQHNIPGLVWAIELAFQQGYEIRLDEQIEQTKALTKAIMEERVAANYPK
jgi:hypothetical protein